MTQNVSIYDGNVKIGTAVATAGSAALATFAYSNTSYVDGRFHRGTKGANNPGLEGRDVEIHSTSGANALGKSHRTRIITDGGTSLTLANAHPYAD